MPDAQTIARQAAEQEAIRRARRAARMRDGDGSPTFTDVTQDRLFYFGCWGRVGHHLYAPGGKFVADREHGEIFGALPRLDGGFTPRTTSRQGAAKLTYVAGWTVLDWHDYSIDSRAGSHSAVIAEGRHSYAAMMGFLAHRFPPVMARQPASITLAEGDAHA